jgi:hypothetical protein
MLRAEATTDGAWEQKVHSERITAFHISQYDQYKAEEEPIRDKLETVRANEAACRQELRIEGSPSAEDSEAEDEASDDSVIIRLLARTIRVDKALVRLEVQMAAATSPDEKSTLFAQRERIKASLTKVCASLEDWNASFGKIIEGGTASADQFISHAAAKASAGIIAKVNQTEAAWVAAAATPTAVQPKAMQVDEVTGPCAASQFVAAGASFTASNIAAAAEATAAAATAAAPPAPGAAACSAAAARASGAPGSPPPAYVPEPQQQGLREVPGFIKTWDPQPRPTRFESHWNMREGLAADRASARPVSTAPQTADGIGRGRRRSERSRSAPGHLAGQHDAAPAGEATFPDSGS